jgi:hypothetical protein
LHLGSTVHEAPTLPYSEPTKFPTRQVFIWGPGLLLVAYFYAYFTAMTTGDVDLAQCHALESAVTARNTIPVSASAPGQPAVFCDRAIQQPFLTHYERVYIYGVTDAAAQDAIVASVRDFQTQHPGKIFVQFIDKENWQPWSDPSSGRSGGKRGPESPQRTLWLK